MDHITHYLSLGWVGSLLGLVGIALSIWFYLRSIRKAVPIVGFESIRLVGNAQSALPEAVTVLYRDRPVPRVTRSTVRIWNGGNSTLDGSLVASVDPIRLEVEPGSEFLSVNVTKLTRDVTQLTAEISPSHPNQAIIKFDFLDPSDGAIIECLHTGNEISPEIKGVIKGISKGVATKDITSYPTTPEKRKRRYLRAVFGIAIMIGGAAMMWSVLAQTPEPIINKTFKVYFSVAMGFVYIALGLLC